MLEKLSLVNLIKAIISGFHTYLKMGQNWPVMQSLVGVAVR